MKKLLPLLLLLSAAAQGSDIDRLIEYDINRRYEDRRAARQAQLDAVVDQGMDIAMQARQQRQQALIAQYQAHPCFETEKALIDELYSMRGMSPAQVAEYWENIRVCHEKYGLEYDDTAEREERAALESGQARRDGQKGGGSTQAHKHESAKRPEPTTKEVVEMAAGGEALGEMLAGGPPPAPGERDAPSSFLPGRQEDSSPVLGMPTVLRPGQKHPFIGHVVLSPLLEWEPEPGYDWNAPPEKRSPSGDWIRFGVHWVPGTEHPDHPHVVAGSQEGAWEAAEGFRFLSHKWGDWRVVPQ